MAIQVLNNYPFTIFTHSKKILINITFNCRIENYLNQCNEIS